MKIATAGSRTSKRWRTQEMSWDAFLARLRTPLRTGETYAEYRRMDKAEQGKKKEAAGGFVGGAMQGGRRVAGAVTERWLITLDADEARRDDWENATMICDNFAMAVYSTHSHSPEKPRLRWVIPLRRGVGREEYQAIARAVAQQLGILETLDATTYQPERLMFWPTCAQDGEYLCNIQDGPFLDPDVVLRWYGPGDAWKDTSTWPIASREKEVVLREAKRQADPESKPGIVGVFCRAYDVPSAIDTFLPDVYDEAGEGRYTYTGGSTSAGAVLYENGAFLYSNHATDPAGGQLCNAFDLVRVHKFGDQDAGQENQETTRLPSYKAMREWCVGLEDLRVAMAEETRRRVEEDFSDLCVRDPGDENTDNDWRRKLDLDPKTGKYLPTIKNAELLLANLPEFKNKIGYNPMSDVITVKGSLPWWAREKTSYLDDMFADEEDEDLEEDSVIGGVSLAGTDYRIGAGRDHTSLLPWSLDYDSPALYRFMEAWDFSTTGQRNGVLDNALKNVAKANEYHPIRSWLMELEWDGVPRVETMLMKWFNVADTVLDREVTKLWMMGGVDRIMRPGCQFDSVLVLTGKQGKGKTKFLRTLARGFYTGSIEKPEVNKTNAEKLQGVWIVEFGELDALKRGDQNAAKNYLTLTSDRYRGAYRHDAGDHPRQCIFAGTSNECSFLRDATGERRYWVVPAPGRDDNGEMIGFADEVPQLWAEAVVLWKERMRQYRRPGQAWANADLMLYLRDPALEQAMEDRRQGYKMPEEDRGMVEAYLDELRPANWYDMEPIDRQMFAHGQWAGDPAICTLRIDRITLQELRYELFRERHEDAGKKSSMSMRLNDIMNTMPGWAREGRSTAQGYKGKTYCWVRKTEKGE